MTIIHANADAVAGINKMLDESNILYRNFRIIAKIDLVACHVPEDFQLCQSEITLNDQVQQFDGFNIIVPKILAKIHGGFTLSCVETNGKTEVLITPDKKAKSLVKASTSCAVAI
jgi:hypothetical protein